MGNKDCPIPPKNAMKVTSQSGITGTKPDSYFVIARTKDGLIPGMYNGTNATYAYAGKEQSTNEFNWIVVANVGTKKVHIEVRDMIFFENTRLST